VSTKVSINQLKSGERSFYLGGHVGIEYSRLAQQTRPHRCRARGHFEIGKERAVQKEADTAYVPADVPNYPPSSTSVIAQQGRQTQ